MAGTPPKPDPPKPGSAPPAPVYVETTNEERTWAFISHLSILAGGILGPFSFAVPLVVWQIKKDESPFVVDQAKEALNFQLSVLIATLVTSFTCLVPIVIAVAGIVYAVMAAVESHKGVCYRYPYTFRMID